MSTIRPTLMFPQYQVGILPLLKANSCKGLITKLVIIFTISKTVLLGRAGRVGDGRAMARASGIGVERSCGGSAGGAKEADALQFPCSLLVGLG